MAESVDKPEASRISIIITTSPVPSNPSTEMLSQVLGSLSHSPYLLKCPILVVFDGFSITTKASVANFKTSKITNEGAIAYKQFQTAVHQLFLSKEEAKPSEEKIVTSTYEEAIGSNTNLSSTITRTILNSKCQTLCHSIRVGFALAVRSALVHVTTPYILILQHDWAFMRTIPVENLLQTLDQDDEMNYIGFVTRRSLDYVNRKTNRAPSIKPEVVDKNGEPFVRLVFWYDRPHVGRTSYYKTQVFGQRRFRRGDFIEDIFGHSVMNDCKVKGIEGWRPYGSWLWCPDPQVPTVRHLNGRTFNDLPGYWTTNHDGEAYYKVTATNSETD